MQICPICKKTTEQNNNWTKCPKLNASICEKHCKKCSSFSGYETTVVFCKFGRKLA